VISVSSSGWLVVTTHGREVTIQRLTAQDGERALLALGYDQDTARVFSNGAERDRVVALARRKKVICGN
jgi:hypothetical protein